MNFSQSDFPQKKLVRGMLENIHKKVGFEGNFPLIFTLSGQSYDQEY